MADQQTLEILLKAQSQGLEQMNRDLAGLKENTEAFGGGAMKAGAAAGAGFAIATKAIEMLGNAATAVIGIAGDLIKDWTDFGSRLTEMAAQTALTVEELQELKFAGEQNGVSIEQQVAGIEKLKNTLIDAPKKIEALGLSVQKLLAMRPAEQYMEVARAIAAIEDPAQRTAAAIDVFGRSGSKLLPVLTSNMSALRDEARSLGGVMSGETAQAADALGDALGSLSTAWEGLQRNVGAMLASSPALVGVVQDIAAVVGLFSVAITENSASIEAWVGWLARAVDPLGLIVAPLKNAANALKDLRAEMEATLRASAGGQDFIKSLNAMREASGGADAAQDEARFQAQLAAAREKAQKAAAAAAKKASAEQEALWKAESTTLANELAERTREYQKQYEEQTAAALAATEAALDAERERIEESNKLFQELSKAEAAAMEAVSQAAEEAAQRTYEEWMKVSDLFGDLGGLVGNIGSLFSALGVEAESGLGRAVGALGAATNAAQGFFASMASGNVAGMVSSAIGGIAGIIGSLFGGGAERRREEEAERQRLLQESEAALRDLADEWDRLRREFVDEGAAGIGSLFENIAQGADASQERIDRLGRMGAAAFALLRAEGLSVVDAMRQMGPAIDAAIRAAAESGRTLSGPLAALADFRQKVLDNEPLVNALDGLSQYVAALRATGQLTQETAADAMAELADLMAQAAGAGFTAEQALALAAPLLYQLAQAAEAGTIALDEETQAMIDQAEALGLFEGLSDPMQDLIDIQNNMLLVLAALAVSFGTTLPAAVQEYIDRLNQIPRNLPPPPGGAEGGTGAGDPGTGGGGPEGREGRYPGAASGGVIPFTGPAMLHGTPSRPEYVLTTDQMDSLRGGGGRGDTYYGGFVINSPNADPRRVADEVARMLDRRRSARLNTAVRRAAR